jgi:hypothetical protein
MQARHPPSNGQSESPLCRSDNSVKVSQVFSDTVISMLRFPLVQISVTNKLLAAEVYFCLQAQQSYKHKVISSNPE